MGKWANYAIVGVRYSVNRSRIVKVKCRTDTGNELVNEVEKTRAEIVSSMLNGESYVTAREGTDKKWVKGDDVIPYSSDGTDFIRTVGNYTKADNLGDLSEF